MVNDKYFTGERKKPMTDRYLELRAELARVADRPASWVGLLADSRPLFEARLQALIQQWLTSCRHLALPDAEGVYVGASNGDEPVYFEIAESFFAALGIRHAWHWLADSGRALPPPSQPCLIVLAGGSVLQGWQVLNAEPWRSWLRRDPPGARVVLGISAGAIQLTGGLDEQGRLWRGLGMQDVMLSVHDELTDWASCSALHAAGVERALCLPLGSAVCLKEGQAWAVTGEPFWLSYQG